MKPSLKITGQDLSEILKRFIAEKYASIPSRKQYSRRRNGTSFSTRKPS